jgi:hypothetical protein
MIRQVSSWSQRRSRGAGGLCGTRQYQFILDPLSTLIGFGELLVGRQIVEVNLFKKSLCGRPIILGGIVAPRRQDALFYRANIASKAFGHRS